MQSFRFKTNWSYLRLLANFPSKIIHNLFLALLTHRFELNYFSIFPLNASFELFICHLNKFKSFPGKQLSFGVKSFAYLTIKKSFPFPVSFWKFYFPLNLRWMIIINICSAAAVSTLLSCCPNISFIHLHFLKPPW